MLRFRAASFSSAVGALQRAGTTLRIAAETLPGKDEERLGQKHFMEAIREAKPAIDELRLSRVLRDQFARLELAGGAGSVEVLSALLVEFNNNLMVEMGSHWFLIIHADRREFYEQSTEPFGHEVAEVFAEANKDIAAASRCFALDEWTACVFHLMRCLEISLRSLAEFVGLPKDAMAHENWKNVIDQIESKIRRMEGEPKSAEKIERLRLLSSAASQFRYFKDAWRNHVAHSHASYDEREAITVWTHVKGFMTEIAPLLRKPA